MDKQTNSVQMFVCCSVAGNAPIYRLITNSAHAPHHHHDINKILGLVQATHTVVRVLK